MMKKVDYFQTFQLFAHLKSEKGEVFRLYDNMEKFLAKVHFAFQTLNQ